MIMTDMRGGGHALSEVVGLHGLDRLGEPVEPVALTVEDQ
jgi:hypothetical protein